MELYKEKRKHKRCACEAEITYCFYNTETCRTATSFNYSQGGMYFETRSPLRPGASIHLQMQQMPFCAPCIENCGPQRTVALAEVKWCKEFQDRDELHYGVGVRYHKPFGY